MSLRRTKLKRGELDGQKDYYLGAGGFWEDSTGKNDDREIKGPYSNLDSHIRRKDTEIPFSKMYALKKRLAGR